MAVLACLHCFGSCDGQAALSIIAKSNQEDLQVCCRVAPAVSILLKGQVTLCLQILMVSVTVGWTQAVVHGFALSIVLGAYSVAFAMRLESALH